MENKIKQIQVLGSGCPTCKKLFELTKQAVKEAGLDANVEYITDIQKVIEMGVMSTPVLAVNGKVVLTGAASDLEKVKKALSEQNDEQGVFGGCSCGNDCGCS